MQKRPGSTYNKTRAYIEMQTTSLIRSLIVGIVHKILTNYDVCGQRALKMAESKEEFVRHS